MKIFLSVSLAVLLLISGSSITAQSTTSAAEQVNSPLQVNNAGKSYRELALEMIYTSGQSGYLDGYIDPSEYTVGPGDEFNVSFVSDDQADISAVINSRGRLFIKSVGAIDLGYISLKDALEKIRAAVKDVFSGLEFSVEIKKFRFSRINIIGQVKEPGTYYVPATWRVSELVSLAGGLTDLASHRSIIIRGFGTAYTVDLIRYNATGDVATNPMLCRGNTVVVPERSNTRGFVSLSGLILNPGAFEYTGDLAVDDYIDFAGGYTGDAKDLQADVYSDDGVQVKLDVQGDEWMHFHPRAGDNIVIGWKADSGNYGFVSIVGEVMRPGKYEITEKDFSLNDLLKLCGGITKDGCLERTQVYRLSIKNKIKVSSTGDGSATGTAAYILSTNTRRQSNNMNLALVDMDSIYIPEKTGLISVQGAIAYPGLVTYRAGKSADYYIDQAGGYGVDADPDRAVIMNQAGGGSIPVAHAGALFDGETIFVPQKEKQGK